MTTPTDRIAAHRAAYPLSTAHQSDAQIAAVLVYLPDAAGEHCEYCRGAGEPLETVRASRRHRRGTWLLRCVDRAACARRQRQRNGGTA